MGWKLNWKYMKGNIKVTVQAKDENEDFQIFTFTCYVSDSINEYDRLDNISDIAHHMALLRNYYHAELIKIEEIPQ